MWKYGDLYGKSENVHDGIVIGSKKIGLFDHLLAARYFIFGFLIFRIVVSTLRVSKFQLRRRFSCIISKFGAATACGIISWNPAICCFLLCQRNSRATIGIGGYSSSYGQSSEKCITVSSPNALILLVQK